MEIRLRSWWAIGLCALVVIGVGMYGYGKQSGQDVYAEDLSLDTRILLPQILASAPLPQYVPAFIEPFDDPNRGWYVGDALRYNLWDRDGDEDLDDEVYMWEVVAQMDYFGGAEHFDNAYRTFIPLTFHSNDYGQVDTWFVRPIHYAPLEEMHYPLPDNYCVAVDGYFSNFLDNEYDPWWATWGLAFGGNTAKTDIYTFQINVNHDRAAIYYEAYDYPGNRQPLSGEPIQLENFLMGWLGHDFGFIESHRPNHLVVQVEGDVASFYVNGHHMGTILVPDMPRDRVGVVVTSWETTPVEVTMDNFIYDPQCAEVWD